MFKATTPEELTEDRREKYKRSRPLGVRAPEGYVFAPKTETSVRQEPIDADFTAHGLAPPGWQLFQGWYP